MARTDSADGGSPVFPRWLYILLTFLGCAAAVLVYQRSFHFGFVYDDELLIVRDPVIHSLRGWTALFFRPMWSVATNVESAYYRPVTSLFFAAEYSIFRQHPFGWHIVTVLLHACATLLTGWAGVRILKDRTAALIGMLLFSVYPLHTEVAAWIAASNESLLAVFVLVAMGSFAEWLNTRKIPWLAVSILSTTAALLAKESAVVVPVLVFGYSWIAGEKSDSPRNRARCALFRTLPFLALVALLFVVRLAVFHRAVGSVTNIKNLTTAFPGLMLQEFRHLLWPFQPAPFHNPPAVLPVGWGIAASGGIVLGLAAASLYWHRRNPVGFFLLVWASVCLLPPLLVSSKYGQLHDRFLYLSSIPVCWAAGVAAATGIRQSLRFRVYSVAASCVLIVLFGIASFVACDYWKDNETLFRIGAKMAPRNVAALNSYASVLASQRRGPEAIELLQASLRLDPDNWAALHQLSVLEITRGDLGNAERHLLHAEEIAKPEARTEFLVTHSLRISIAMRTRDWQEASQLLRDVLKVAPENEQFQDALAYCIANEREQEKGTARRR